MITIQQETDQNNTNTKNDDDDDDCVIVDNPLDNFKDLKTHKEITDGLKAKLIVDDQEVSHHFYCLDNDYVDPNQKLLETAESFDKISIHECEVIVANYRTSLNENHRVTEAREGNFFVVNDKPVSKDGKAVRRVSVNIIRMSGYLAHT